MLGARKCIIVRFEYHTAYSAGPPSPRSSPTAERRGTPRNAAVRAAADPSTVVSAAYSPRTQLTTWPADKEYKYQNISIILSRKYTIFTDMF